ncbi:MAG TPA: NAD+ synthase [Solirubrobacterales bacterium]|nr:NAD+ synthase [Solirubrobacterales bacterium]
MAADAVRLRIGLAQVNPTVGDIEGNARLISTWIDRAREAGAQLVVFPEQTITGYPAEDLWLKPHFLDAAGEAVAELASGVGEIAVLVGFPEHEAATHNSVAVLGDGQVRAVYRKILLPNYGVFDERRYFEPGDAPALIEVAGARVGLTICEDIWYPGPPASVEALAGASLIVNPSASPYHRGRGAYRERLVQDRARETGAAFAVCNLVGGQDELVFDGHSVVVSAQGQTLARAAQFVEELVLCDLELAPRPAAGSERADEPQVDAQPAGASAPLLARLQAPPSSGEVEPQLAEPLEAVAEVYEALKLGLRDYVFKNGFERVLVAVSGGIDSALVTVIAADALGPERVSCVVMPSPHSGDETQADARAIARAVGAELVEIPIEDAMLAYEKLLAASEDGSSPAPGGPGTELAAENIQARIRGNLMMALSNMFGWLVLTTGNKSEMSVGYATLYGDMAGGFAVIKDVPKTLVYELVRYRNGLSDTELVPESVLERAPSAELRPGQLDQDSLPPYEMLDRILAAYVQEDRGRDEIVSDGLPAAVVDEVIAMVDRSEYKRRQAPPGIRITPKAFGRDRRLPITNRFRG